MLPRTLVPVALVSAFAACGGAERSEGGATGDALRTDALLTTSELEAVRRSIDDVCGDSWCEGDFDWSFDKLTCSKRTKTCTFEIAATASISVFDGNDDVLIAEPRYPNTCTIKGIDRREDVVDRSGRDLTYSESFYEKVSDCIAEHEEKIRPLVWKEEVLAYAKRCVPDAEASVTLEDVPRVWNRDEAIARAKDVGHDAFPSQMGELAWTVSDVIEPVTPGRLCAKWSPLLATYKHVVSVRGVAADGLAVEVVLMREEAQDAAQTVQETRLVLKNVR